MVNRIFSYFFSLLVCIKKDLVEYFCEIKSRNLFQIFK